MEISTTGMMNDMKWFDRVGDLQREKRENIVCYTTLGLIINLKEVLVMLEPL